MNYLKNADFPTAHLAGLASMLQQHPLRHSYLCKACCRGSSENKVSKEAKQHLATRKQAYNLGMQWNFPRSTDDPIGLPTWTTVQTTVHVLCKRHYWYANTTYLFAWPPQVNIGHLNLLVSCTLQHIASQSCSPSHLQPSQLCFQLESSPRRRKSLAPSHWEGGFCTPPSHCSLRRCSSPLLRHCRPQQLHTHRELALLIWGAQADSEYCTGSSWRCAECRERCPPPPPSQQIVSSC